MAAKNNMDSAPLQSSKIHPAPCQKQTKFCENFVIGLDLLLAPAYIALWIGTDHATGISQSASPPHALPRDFRSDLISLQ